MTRSTIRLITLLIALTGDSHTIGYSPYFTPESPTIASGGCTTPRYLGREVDPYAVPPAAHDFAVDALALSPRVVVVMLGTNDAFRAVVDQNHADVFKADMVTIVHGYRMTGVRVVLVVPPPILPDAPNAHPNAAAAAVILETDLAPFLRTLPATVVVDAFSDIQMEPNWQDFYYTDGVHLYGPGGYPWLANRIAAACWPFITR